MNWGKHGWASLAGLVAFIVLTLSGGAWSPAAWYTLLGLAVVMAVVYRHYRRRSARREQVKAVIPVVPGMRDDREIPNEVKTEVALRDKGVCQIKGPRCVVGATVWDHKIPYSWGGPSKTADNIQQACQPCNNWKSDNFADTPAGRITFDEWKSLQAA